MARRRWWVLATSALLCSGGVRFYQSLDSGLQHPRPSHLLLDRRGKYLGEVAAADDALGYWPLPSVLPERIAVATLQTEDRRFYEHQGVSLSSFARAAWQNARNLQIISGASTIAMQVARLQHPAARGLWAKLHEAAEAVLLVREHGHDQVLRQYLTIAPYGNRARGVVRASRLYFDKPVEDLSWLQAAFLAALPQQPGRMSPWSSDGQARALRRAHRILNTLHQRGVIDEVALQQALGSSLGLVPRPRSHPEAVHLVLDFARASQSLPLVATSTVDLELQQLTARAVADNVRALAWANVGNASALVVDVPTGQVLAQVGSTDYFDQPHHGAIDYLKVRRSPGSALKPFVYGLGLERGLFTAASELPDTPIEFPLLNGSTYVPENMNHAFLGPMLFRQALGNSRNIPALRVLSEVGVEHAVDLFERGGVKGLSRAPDAYGLTLAIGSLPVTAEELAVLYTALANRGTTTPLLHFVDEPPGQGARLFSPDTATMIAHILSDPSARRPGFPAGGAMDFDSAVAIKTGTSQSSRDAWAVAFSDRLLVVTWVGNHDWSRMNKVTGASAAAPVAHRVLDELMPLRAPDREVTASFPVPAQWVPRDICALSGRLAGPACTGHRTEFFAPGSAPTSDCPFHVPVELDVRNGLLAGPGCPRAYVVTRQLLELPYGYESWARHEKVEVAPSRHSPLCPVEPGPVTLAIEEPRHLSRYLFDPDTPRELSTVRLAAKVSPATEEIVWLVDGTPVGKVGWPHELRASLAPGTHVIRAAMAHSAQKSAPVTVIVDD